MANILLFTGIAISVGFRQTIKWLPFVLSSALLSHYFIKYTTILPSYFYLVCRYFTLRAKLIIKRVQQMSRFKTNFQFINCMQSVYKDHNTVCRQLHAFAIFWDKYYFNVIITLFPINLLLLTAILFSNFKFYVILLIIFTIIFTWISIFFISFCASLVSKSMRLSTNQLYIKQLALKRNLHQKIKLMIFYEKLHNKRVMYGFSIGPLFIMTFNKLSIVCKN